MSVVDDAASFDDILNTLSQALLQHLAEGQRCQALRASTTAGMRSLAQLQREIEKALSDQKNEDSSRTYSYTATVGAGLTCKLQQGIDYGLRSDPPDLALPKIAVRPPVTILRRKWRILTAVRPYEGLTTIASNMTLLEALFGQSFDDWLRQWKHILLNGPLVLTLFVANAILVQTSLLAHLTELHASILAVLYALFAAFVMLRQSSFAIFSLFVRALWSVDAMLFMAENFLFSISLTAVLCFRFSQILVTFITFLSTAQTFLMYDGYPVGLRKGMRVPLVIWSLGWALILPLIYFEYPPQMCDYHLDLLHGLVDPADNTVPRSTWSISVKEVCLNRGFTLLLLMIRTTYLAFKHPNDCVFIRSRIRVLEIPMASHIKGAGDCIGSSVSPQPDRQQKDGAPPDKLQAVGE